MTQFAVRLEIPGGSEADAGEHPQTAAEGDGIGQRPVTADHPGLTGRGTMPGSSTVAVHADRDVHLSRAVARPIYQTAAFWAEDAEQFAQAATGQRGHDFYTRMVMARQLLKG